MQNEKNVYIKGKIITDAIKKNNTTQSEVCKVIGIRDDKLSEAIHNKCSLAMDKVRDLCDLLEINPNIVVIPKKDIKSILLSTANWNDDYFKGCLKVKGIKQLDLAKALHKSEGLFWNYKSGRANIPASTLVNICKILSCTPEGLLGITGTEINALAGMTVFNTKNSKTVKKDSNVSTEVKTNSVNNDISDADDESLALVERPSSYINDFKHFESTNVLTNIETINENILTGMKYINEIVSVKDECIYELRDLVLKLTAKVDNLETQLNAFKSMVETVKENNDSKKPTSTGIKYPAYIARYCSDKELEQITKSTVTNDDLSTYKDKIYKLAGYKSKKMNLPVNNIMHDAYVQFTKVYGLNFSDLKAQSKTKESLDALYSNDLCREIFFNMMCTNATS